MVGKRREHGFHARRHRALASALQLSRMNWDWPAVRRQLLLNLFQRASRNGGTVVLVDVPGGIFSGVLMLNHQPFVAFFALFQFHQDKTPPQFLPIQAELDFSLLQLPQRVEIALDMKNPAVPNHYRSRSIIAFGNFSFEVGVVQRVIFRLDRQPLVGVALGRSLGNGPRLQRPIDRQPEIVVQPRCPVLLNHEGVAVLTACRGRFIGRGGLILDLTGDGLGLAGRLRGPVKAAFSPVFFQLGHGRILSQTFRRPAGLPLKLLLFSMIAALSLAELAVCTQNRVLCTCFVVDLERRKIEWRLAETGHTSTSDWIR